MMVAGRRQWLRLLAAGFILSPAAVARGQAAANARRIAWLSAGSRATHGEFYNAFRAGLLDYKYIVGRNILIEERWADGWSDRVPALARELVALKPEVIVTSGTSIVEQLRRATTTIPIVAISTADPVRSGFAASLARPGGNITGGTNMNTDTLTKLVEIAREALPAASRAALLHSDDPVHPQLVDQARAAGRSMKLAVIAVKATRPPEIDMAVAAAVKEKAEVLIVLPNVFFNSQRGRIAQVAAKYRLPVVAPRSEYAESGAVVAYGPNLAYMYRRAASYVDRILRGAKPGDLPMEQPTKFDLVINARTAKALGLLIPPSLLARADKVLEQ